MSLEINEIKKLADLAKIQLDDQKACEFAKEFEPIIDFANQIIKADVECEIITNPINMDDLREDEVKPSMPTEKVLLNAPEQMLNCFTVNRLFEGGE